MFFRTDPCRMDIGIAPDDDGAGLRGKTMRRSVPGLRNVRVGPEEKSNGRLRKSGGSERRRTGAGRYCGPGGARGGGGELRRVFESGKFGPVSVVRLCGCAGRNRPFVPERFPDRSGRHDEENARKTAGRDRARVFPGRSLRSCGVGIIPRSPRRGSPRPRQGPSRRCSGPRW